MSLINSLQPEFLHHEMHVTVQVPGFRVPPGAPQGRAAAVSRLLPLWMLVGPLALALREDQELRRERRQELHLCQEQLQLSVAWRLLARWHAGLEGLLHC